MQYTKAITNGELASQLSCKLNQLAATPMVFLTTINNKNIYLKQDYLNHPTIQGNKLRKLKYSLLAASETNNTVISFGGAYSNHIAALAAAGNEFNLQTVGIIRGEELADASRWSDTLQMAHANGMKLHFVSREAYRQKEQHQAIKDLIKGYNNHSLIPEGGSNQLSVLGTMEVMTEVAADKTVFNRMLAASGTGGTLAGLIDGTATESLHCHITGIAVLKAEESITQTIRELSQHHEKVTWEINSDYHFSGYAKTTQELQDFQQQFEVTYKIPLDPIYTAKLCYAVLDLAAKSHNNQHENWLIYHSGGLQGCYSHAKD